MENNIYKKILAASEAVGYLQKNDENTQQHYKFVSAEKIIAAVNKAIRGSGLYVGASVESVEELPAGTTGSNKTMYRQRIMLKATVYDTDVSYDASATPDAKVEFTFFADGFDMGDKGLGKATTYALKYALRTIFLIETGDDPDRETVEETTQMTIDDKLDVMPSPAAEWFRDKGWSRQKVIDQCQAFGWDWSKIENWQVKQLVEEQGI